MYYLLRVRMDVETTIDHSEGSLAQLLQDGDVFSLNFPIIRLINIPLKIQNVNP